MTICVHPAPGRRPSAASGLVVPMGLAIAFVSCLAAVGDMGYAIPLLACALAAGCAVLAGAALGMPWALGAILAFSVFALNINFRVREVGDVGLDWQNGLKFSVWIGVIAVAALRWHRIGRITRDPALILAVAYAAVCLASAAWSPTPAYTAASAVGLVSQLCLAALLATELGEERTLGIMTASLAAFVALGLLGGVAFPDLAFSPPSDVETAYRLQGFSGHPNILGQQAAILCLLAAAGRRTGMLGRRGLWVAMALGLAAVLASRSRFGLTAFLLSWAHVALRGRPILPMACLALAFAGAATLLFAAVHPLPNPTALFSDLSRTGTSDEILTLTGRTDLWTAAAGKIAERPLFGWGYNGTEGLLLEDLDKSFHGSGVNAHNMTVQTLLSVGILGSLPAFGFLGILIARMLRDPEDLRDLVTGFILVNGLGEVEIFGTPVLLTFVAYWVIARHAAARARAPHRATKPC